MRWGPFSFGMKQQRWVTVTNHLDKYEQQETPTEDGFSGFPPSGLSEKSRAQEDLN